MNRRDRDSYLTFKCPPIANLALVLELHDLAKKYDFEWTFDHSQEFQEKYRRDRKKGMRESEWCRARDESLLMQMWSKTVRDGWETRHSRPREYEAEVANARRHRLLVSGIFVMEAPDPPSRGRVGCGGEGSQIVSQSARNEETMKVGDRVTLTPRTDAPDWLREMDEIDPTKATIVALKGDKAKVKLKITEETLWVEISRLKPAYF